MTNNFEYFNINDVDPTFQAIEKGVYGFRVGKMEYKIIAIKNGKNAGQEVPVINGNFTVINSDTYSGRRLRHTFWVSNPYDQKALRRLADAVGVMQEPGEPLKDYIDRLSTTQPPLEFRTFADTKPVVDRATGEMVMDAKGNPQLDNEMKWNQVLPIA